MKKGILVGTGLASASVAVGAGPWEAAVVLGCLLLIDVLLVALFAFYALRSESDLTLRHYHTRRRREHWTISLRRTSRRGQRKDRTDSK